jgi:(p)ppGpp synthase/HD superfamily hydrolase
MRQQNRPLDAIYDLIGVRIITATKAACYQALGVVHDLYKPVPERFKDFIATPKSNLYQSLHTTVIGPGGRFVEVQIRTQEMHRIAEVGIAAHYSYKEGRDRAS